MAGSMRLLYVCGTYAPGAFAGSELSVHELLQELSANHSIDVLVVTDARYTGGKPGRSAYQKVPLYTVDRRDRRKGISEAIAKFRPNAILTQLIWCDVAMEVGKAAGIPIILRLPGGGPKPDFSIPAALIANTRTICRSIREKYGREVDYVPSAINVKRVIVDPADRRPRFIAMFNPITIKGGRVLRAIAENMPDREFAVVPGWYSLRTADGSWDPTIIATPDWSPEDVSFSGLANVQVLPPRENVAEIYAQVRILLVPSQWQETLARVAIEAFANGIPVIASNVGGLRNHAREAGIVVNKNDVPAWIEAIKRLDDPRCYEMYAHKGREYAATKYTIGQATEAFLTVLARVCQ
jgi:glycosyltransferase involved in cell wall biosynthesis